MLIIDTYKDQKTKDLAKIAEVEAQCIDLAMRGKHSNAYNLT